MFRPSSSLLTVLVSHCIILILNNILPAYAINLCSSISGGSYCPCQLASGAILDLSPLSDVINTKKEIFKDRPDSGNKTKVKYLYSYQPCKGFDEETCKAAAVCQLTLDKTKQYEVGHQDRVSIAGKGSKGEGDPGSLVITYKGDDKKEAHVRLACVTDKGLEPRLEVFGEGAVLKQYNFTLHTQYACPFYKSHSDGLSTGSILLIVLFVLVLLYLIGGAVAKYLVQGARGVEMIPNLEFWSDLPRLVKDGVMFCIGGCKTDQTYNQI